MDAGSPLLRWLDLRMCGWRDDRLRADRELLMASDGLNRAIPLPPEKTSTHADDHQRQVVPRLFLKGCQIGLGEKNLTTNAREKYPHLFLMLAPGCV